MPDRHPKAAALQVWNDERYFGHPDFSLSVAAIDDAVVYQDNARIEAHDFFRVHACDKRVLRMWAEQEMVTSASFSQALFEWMATIDNCHVRSLVMPVLSGEHGRVWDGLARRSHPFLARALCTSLGSDFESVTPIEPTVRFINLMEEAAETPMGGAGFLGIGNERMLVPEYSAIRSCYARVVPAAEYSAFLDANIADDQVHHELIERAAAGLVSLGADAAEFLAGAHAGVDARIAYYDSLVEICKDTDQLEAVLSG